MDSLNGTSSGCNFIVNPTCANLNHSSVFMNNNGVQVHQQQTVQTSQNPYFNSFNNNVFNPEAVGPLYIQSVSQHVNQIVQALNSLLSDHSFIEKKSNYVELMSTVFEGVRGEEYYINYEREASKRELVKMRRLMKIGFNSGVVRGQDMQKMASVLSHSMQSNTLNSTGLNLNINSVNSVTQVQGGH